MPADKKGSLSAAVREVYKNAKWPTTPDASVRPGHGWRGVSVSFVHAGLGAAIAAAVAVLDAKPVPMNDRYLDTGFGIITNKAQPVHVGRYGEMPIPSRRRKKLKGWQKNRSK